MLGFGIFRKLMKIKFACGTATSIDKSNTGLITLSPNILRDLTDCFESGNRSYPESFRSPGERGVMYLFITAAFIFTILGNLDIIISISYFKWLHSLTNFLILSMAINVFPTELCCYAPQHGKVCGEWLLLWDDILQSLSQFQPDALLSFHSIFVPLPWISFMQSATFCITPAPWLSQP